MNISKILLTAVIASCAFGIGLNATESARHARKHYLDEQAISVTSEGIVLKTKNGQVRVKTLRSNSKGIYVYKQDIYSVAEKGEVVCDWCGRWFPNRGSYCHHLPCPKH